MKLRICEITTNIEFLSEAKIKEAVLKRCIRRWCYILHDKDVYTEEDERIFPEHKAGTLKHPHWHIYLQFTEDNGQYIKSIAKWFGVQESCVEKSKSGHYEDMCLYAVHKNASEKYQYSISEVNASFNYEEFVGNQGKLKTRIEEITEQIVNGYIRQFNYTDFITGEEYVKYSAQIDKAFKYRIDLISSANRNLEVIFISGKSGYGKTVLAKNIAENKGYSYFISGSDNDLLDGYKGQDCLILDDLRGCSLKFSDFIKMIDNNTNSLVKSRYYNKNLTECKLIIITSIHNLDTFYNNIFSEQDEPLVQFKRRCKTMLKLENKEFYDAYSYSFLEDEYFYVGSFKNPALEYLNGNTNKNREDIISLLGNPSIYIKLDLTKKENKKIISSIENVPF